MKEDPFITFCNKLNLDFYSISGIVSRSESPKDLAKALDIDYRDAFILWELYHSHH